MSVELRCPNGILFANLNEEGHVEVKCRSKRCGAKAGVVVLHFFDPATGEMVRTEMYKDPAFKEVKENDSNASLRFA